MEPQIAPKEIGDETASEINLRSAGYPPQDIIADIKNYCGEQGAIMR